MNIDLYNDDCLNVLRKMNDNSINCVITSPPYFNLRDYDSSLGNEDTVDEFVNNLIKIFNEVYRVLTDDGSCWVNISDTYKDKCLLCVPDKFKIAMIQNGWICRNEVIWHKPNAMPSSCKDRFNNDYEKFYFFVKKDNYKFNTQYEPCLSKCTESLSKDLCLGKYESVEQESSVRQGLNKARGSKILELRKNLPTKEEFLNFIRFNSRKVLYDFIDKTTVDHWFRTDDGFSYPKICDWEKIKHLYMNVENFEYINSALTKVTYETDSILKNISKGRIKRSVWSINTKPSKYNHYAMFPTELIVTPINACTDKNDTIMDCFMGSGTTGEVSKILGRNFIGIELNPNYFKIAEQRIKESDDIFEI